MPTPRPSALSDTRPTPRQDPGLTVVNQTRAKHHRAPLQVSAAAARLALAHSLAMAHQQRVSP